jgi:virulence-associated protein VapD
MDPALNTAANSHGDIQTSLTTCGANKRKTYLYLNTRDIARIETEINVESSGKQMSASENGYRMKTNHM